MQCINEERKKGDLDPTTLNEILKELQVFEARSLEAILTQLAKEMEGVALSSDHRCFMVNGQIFPVNRLKYVVNKDGSEEVVFVTRIGRKRRVILVKPAAGLDGQET